MKRLFSSDYVLYDKANDQIVVDSTGKAIIYASKKEAEIDCYGNEYIVSCTELPVHLQNQILTEIK